MRYRSWSFDLDHSAGRLVIKSTAGGGLDFQKNAAALARGLWRFSSEGVVLEVGTLFDGGIPESASPRCPMLANLSC
jgi:hypothetical protein